MTTCKLYLAYFQDAAQPVIAPSFEFLNNFRTNSPEYKKLDILHIETVTISPQNYLAFSEKYHWFFKNLTRAILCGPGWLVDYDAIRWHELVWLAWKIFIIEDEAWMKKRCEENSKNSSQEN